MSEWRECKLGDIADVKGGKRLPKGELLTTEKTPHPYIRITDFNGYKINLSNILYVNEEVQKSISRYIVNKQDIILSIVGTIGLCAKVPDELDNANLTENCIKLVFDKNKIDTNFLYYHLISPDTQELIGGLDVGSTQPKLPIYNVQKIDISLPPLEEQKAIAEVLSSLDDKIDLLHRQNKTLEELAQTLFRQWFVEGEETISYLFEELVDSISVKHKFNNDKVIFLNTSDVYDGKVLHNNYSTVSGLPGQAKKSIKKGDILFTEIRPANKRFAFIDFEADDYVVSTKLMVLRSKNVLDTSIVYLFLKQQDTLNYLQMLAESRSGTFPQITFDHLKTVEIFVPKDKDILESITNIFKDIVTKTFSNHIAIKTLENMRDTLLPKLMSGEVRVEI
jgi:type I restriction enzyme S subunit